jgi:hypothetical protein
VNNHSRNSKLKSEERLHHLSIVDRGNWGNDMSIKKLGLVALAAVAPSRLVRSG